ncbi:MAG TPA: hypothetical protein VGI88_02400 [Verrucomicrobiae bacterium]
MSPIGGTHSGRGSFQNAPAEIEFERLQLSGDGGLGNVQTLRRTTEAAFLKDDQEQAKLFQHD